jgi:hypothetical protein
MLPKVRESQGVAASERYLMMKGRFLLSIVAMALTLPWRKTKGSWMMRDYRCIVLRL